MAVAEDDTIALPNLTNQTSWHNATHAPVYLYGYNSTGQKNRFLILFRPSYSPRKLYQLVIDIPENCAIRLRRPPLRHPGTCIDYLITYDERKYNILSYNTYSII